jgi:hypothetical protein
MPPYPAENDCCWKLKPKFGILSTVRGFERPLDCNLDDKFFLSLNAFPFHSLRHLSGPLKGPLPRIRNHLPRTGFVLEHLKKVPRTFSTEHKRNWVELAGWISQHHSWTRQQGWGHFDIGDESCFYLNTDYERI